MELKVVYPKAFSPFCRSDMEGPDAELTNATQPSLHAVAGQAATAQAQQRAHHDDAAGRCQERDTSQADKSRGNERRGKSRRAVCRVN